MQVILDKFLKHEFVMRLPETWHPKNKRRILSCLADLAAGVAKSAPF